MLKKIEQFLSGADADTKRQNYPFLAWYRAEYYYRKAVSLKRKAAQKKYFGKLDGLAAKFNRITIMHRQ